MDRAEQGLNRRTLLATGLSAAVTCTLLPAPALAKLKSVKHSYGADHLDLYSVAQARGTVLYVHGGAWRFGSRRNVEDKPAWFAGMGMNFVSIDYPTLPRAPVSEQIRAVRQAIDWSFKNVMPPEKTVVMGYASGAHLVAMATLTGWVPRPAGAILNDSGALDLITLSRAHQGHLPMGTASAFKDRAQWGAMSPAYHLSRNLPPVLAIWSNAHGHATATANFAANMRGIGGDISLFDGRDYGPGAVNRKLGSGRIPDLERAIYRFMQKVL